MDSMKSKILLSVLVFISFITATAQVKTDEVLMTIAGKQVRVSEFMNIYQKNNVKNENIDKKSLNEYLDLFINFKLKVKQAEELGLDTMASFRNELNGYREQLAKPYFTDEAIIDGLVREAFERQSTDLRASHIFFRLKPDPTPEDTLIAYNKAMSVREKLLKDENSMIIWHDYGYNPETPRHSVIAAILDGLPASAHQHVFFKVYLFNLK